MLFELQEAQDLKMIDERSTALPYDITLTHSELCKSITMNITFCNFHFTNKISNQLLTSFSLKASLLTPNGRENHKPLFYQY